MFSPSEENYIKAIFHLQKKNQNVSTNSVAESMKTRAASVTDMVKKLKVKGLIDYEPYQGVTLTRSGRKAALEIVRRHRLWEFFLVSTLGFQWDEVHEIAEELEHIQHPLLIDKLDAFLGHPKFDPHGDPIPDKDGKMALAEYKSLTEVKDEEEVVFASVGLQTPELMQVLNHKNISLGDEFTLLHKYDFDQSLEVLINKKHQVSLSYRLARYLLVKPKLTKA
jgi:DtxR family transcriptional regulator, Mn-dependent transcriptional regulator